MTIGIDLTGKTALVTGASAGIGRAIAVELAKCGAHVIVNYHSSEDGARETLTALEAAGGSGAIFGANVADSAAVAKLIAFSAEHTGKIDILVNNAGGLLKRAKTEEMTEALWDEVMAVNLKSTFLCCKMALPHMPDGGRIVNMSSVAAHDGGGPGASAYAASKAAVLAYTKGLAKEVAPRGITANCLAPGLIATAFHDVFSTPEMRAATVRNTPLAREGQASDVAGAVLFLVSPLADFITGETININGGTRLC